MLRRLRVTSFVCKHWRTIALRSVKKLPCLHLYTAHDRLPFTSLTQLNLSKLTPAIDAHLRCPSTVRELKLPACGPVGTTCALERIHRIPRPLVGITISSGPQECKRAIKIFHRSRESIQSLTYTGPLRWAKPGQDNTLRQYINSHRFPALTSLTMEDDVLADACINHAAQLTRLVILFTSPKDLDSCCGPLRGLLGFPHLTELDVPAKLLSDDIFAVANMPALRSLTLRNLTTARLHALCATVACYQLSLHLSDYVEGIDKPALFTALAACPSLVCVHIEGAGFNNTAALLESLTASRSTLTSLKLPASLSLSQLASFPRLRRLEVHQLTYNATMPSLTHLSVAHDAGNSRRLLVLPSHFPRLCSLMADVDYPEDAAQERTLIQCLQQLGESGVHRIRLSLALYAQADKRKGVCKRVVSGCTASLVRVSIDDRSSETEETTAEEESGLSSSESA